MKPLKGAFPLQAGLITPLLFLAAVMLGCAFNYTLALSGETPPKDVFPEIKRRARLSVNGSEAGVELRVFYAPGEEELAAEALAAVKKPAQFLRDATGMTASSSASFYLYPLPADGSIPSYSPRGPGTFTGVFLYHQGEQLLSFYFNRYWLNSHYPHELAHSFLGDAGLRLEDRWLGDGLPEYLASEFARNHDPEIAKGDNHLLPPSLVALSRATLEPWNDQDAKTIEKKLSTDREYALLLAERMSWRYAAAKELVRHWMTAARKTGIEDPLQDLLARIRSLGKPVDWNATRQLAKAQTGRSFEELARVSAEDLSAAQVKAWEERADPNLEARVHAISVLAELGLPDGATAEELMPAFSIPDEFSDVRLGWVRRMIHQGGQALARANNPGVAAKVVELAESRWGADGTRFVPPELWQVLATTNRKLALEQLVATITRSDSTLSIKAGANEALRSLTGQDMGWSVEGTPEQRRQAADRWRAALAGA